MPTTDGVWLPQFEGQSIENYLANHHRPDTGEARLALRAILLAIGDLDDPLNPYRSEAAKWVLGYEAALPFELACSVIGVSAEACRDRLKWRYPLTWLAQQRRRRVKTWMR